MTPPLLITPGDPVGIGPEVSARAALAMGLDAVLLGDVSAMRPWTGPLPELRELAPVRGLALMDPRSVADSGEPVEVQALRVAVAACLRGEGRALVTGPIHKARLAARGFHHAGHTGFLGELCGVPSPVMAFVGGELRVALVTVHLPLSQVAQAVTREAVLHTLRVCASELILRLRIPAPRLLVCGLNPHAGDEGLLGREEIDHIAPAIADARAEGIAAIGPVSAEAAFRRMRAGDADMVLAMYHDQGLAPLKLVDFGRSVNWTLGLPIVRTSVDHGTADDIAGKGLADPSSMQAALALALQLTRMIHHDPCCAPG